MVKDIFQGEDKILDEDVIKKQPREFQPTFSEWAADNVEQIIKSDTSNNGSSAIYQVPVNFTLFITSCFIAHLSSSASQAIIHLGNDSSIKNILVSRSKDQGCNNSLSFLMPLKVSQGETIFLTSTGAGNGANGGIQGFLLPKKISIR